MTLGFAGSVTDSRPLADGRNTLTVRRDHVSTSAGQLDGTAGDIYETQTAAGSFGRAFRLSGNSNGSGTVDAIDFGAFRAAFGTNNSTFDFDGGGSVDALDFGQFRARFGTGV